MRSKLLAMFWYDLLNGDLPLWMTGAALMAGLSAAVLVFLVGYHFLLHYWPSSAYPVAEDSQTPTDLLERRRWPRRWGNPVPVLVQDACEVRPVHGVVVNRSTDGVAVLIDRRFEPGTVLSLRPPEASEGVPWVRVEVVHHRRARRQWMVGCQFVEPPPWNVWVWLG